MSVRLLLLADDEGCGETRTGACCRRLAAAAAAAERLMRRTSYTPHYQAVETAAHAVEAAAATAAHATAHAAAHAAAVAAEAMGALFDEGAHFRLYAARIEPCNAPTPSAAAALEEAAAAARTGGAIVSLAAFSVSSPHP